MHLFGPLDRPTFGADVIGCIVDWGCGRLIMDFLKNRSAIINIHLCSDALPE